MALTKINKKIPENVEKLYLNYDTYRFYQIQLTYIIHYYNNLLDNITELDYSVLNDEFLTINYELNKLINSLKWNSESNNKFCV